MKSILKISLVLLICALIMTVVGCVNDNDKPHTHQYSEEITKAPTCTEEGVKTFTCTVEGCDKPTYTEPVAKLPHTEVKLDGKAATCTEAGLSEGKKCSACGEITVKQETIPAAGHKEETLAAKAPTCTETGLTAGKKCSECDIVLEAQSTVPATGHKYDDEYDATCNNEGCDFVRDAACRHTNTEVLAAEAATCTKTGLTEGLKCKDCEEILTSQEIVPIIAHSWTLATCTAPKTCSVCKATEGEALGHHWKPATCTDPKTCQRENCGVTEGEALGHDWKDATCTAPQICSVCTATQGEALGHKWNNATCDTPKTCSVCKATEGKALGHDYGDATYAWGADNKSCTATKVCKNDPSHVVTENGKVTVQTVPASCIAEGTVTYTATFTQDGFVKQTKSAKLEKLPHVYGSASYDWSNDYKSCTAVKNCTGDNCYANISENVTAKVVTVASTCTVKGSVTYTVDFKNSEFEDQTHVEVLPLANHNLVTNSKPATCTETGLTEILKCTNCSYTEGTQEIIPLQPHTYDDSEGYATECSVCHTPRPACKHEDVEIIKGYAATCEKEGLTDGEICKTCGATVKGQTTISKAAHTPGAAATCTEPQICTVCKVVLNKATDHSFGAVSYEWITSNGEIVACKATRTCQNGCGTSENETANAEGKIVVDAKCGQPGTKTYTAVFTTNTAFKTQTKDVTIPALEHEYTSVVTKPTCTAGGYTTHTCSKCGDEKIDTETEKLGHKPASDDGDCTTAITCTVCGEETTPAKEAHTPAEDDGDCTTAVKCADCDQIAVKANASHTAGTDDNDCTTPIKCIHCDKIAVEGKAHTPAAKTDCTAPTMCSVCSAKIADGNNEHTWSKWTANGDKHTRYCTVDGCNKTDAQDHTPKADDGDCTTAIECTGCGAITTPAKDAHTPAEDDGDCTTAIKCIYCGTVTTPAKDNHTPAEDDGDCTTAIMCTDCGTVIIPAKDAHTPAEDDGDCTTEVVCTVCGTVTTAAKEHNMSGWTPAEDGKHNMTCQNDGCNKTETADHVYTNACDATCDDCGAERTVNAHVYYHDCDASCNVCGTERAVSGHEYTGTTCNKCGYDTAGKNNVANGGFESGMDGWTVVGNIGNVSSNPSYWGGEFGMDGDKMFSAYEPSDMEKNVGTLTSSGFIVGGSGFVTFKVGGMRDGNYVYIDVVEAGTDKILARYYNPLCVQGETDCDLIAYKADLSAFRGKEVYFRISDNADSGYGLFFADSFITYYENEPEGFNEAAHVNYQLPATIYDLFNGGFEMGDVQGWWNIGDAGAVTGADAFFSGVAYGKDGGFLYSGVEDRGAGNGREGNQGTLTSSVFQLGGSGYITYMLGGGNDYCYVQVIDAVTGEMLARYKQQAREDAVLKSYVADLSAYIGRTVRIQVVDNASSDWGCVSFDNVVTYYASKPDGFMDATDLLAGLKAELQNDEVTEQGDYTADSYNNYVEKLNAVKNNYLNNRINQADLDASVSALTDARVGLTLRAVEEVADANKSFNLISGNNKEITLSDYINTNNLSNITYEVSANNAAVTLSSIADGKFTITAAKVNAATDVNVSITVKYNGETKLTVVLSVKVTNDVAPTVKGETIEKSFDVYNDGTSFTLDLSENVDNAGNLPLTYSVNGAAINGSGYTYTAGGSYNDVAVNDSLTVTVSYTANGKTGTISYTYSLSIKDSTDYRLVNGGFENGLEGWTQVGQIGNVGSNKYYWETNEFGMDGDKMFSAYEPSDMFEKNVGTLTSASFIVGGSGFVTFKVGAMRDQNYVYVDVVEADTGKILARYYNGLWTEENSSGCKLVAYKADLSAFAGKEVYFRISDNADSYYGLFFADSFITYYESEPDGFNAATPVSYELPATIYDLFNGGFEMGSDLGWWNVGNAGAVTGADAFFSGVAYGKNGNFLYSGVEDHGAGNGREGNKGTLTSSVFQIGGSGYITYMLGGGNNSCYVQIIDSTTGEILARYRQQAREDAVLKSYVADLSAYVGRTVRIQVVDNATFDWGCISFDNVVTYYASKPEGFIDAVDVKYEIVNGSFENGLNSWNMNITEAGAQNTLGWVESSEHDADWYTKNDDNKDGSNIFTFCRPDGTNCENSKGTLSSDVFTLKQNSYVSFRFGGAGGVSNHDVWIELVKADGEVIARFYNDATDKVNTRMNRFYYQYTGEEADCFFRVVDNSTGDYGCFVVDDFRVNLEAAPEGSLPAVLQ